jgi:pimeloyl-ACP methyl ester carboxylesterase
MADTALGVDDGLAAEIIGNLEKHTPVLGRGGFTREYQEQQPVSYFLYTQISGLNSAPQPTAPPTPVGKDLLASFRVPTLFLVGSEDYLVTPEIIARACAIVPGSRYTVIRGPGHGVYWEQPAIFNHIVESFFESEE